MVTQLKEISEAANSTDEENEFEVFGKHIGLQLQSLPLLLALEAREHIQLYINRIRRQHFQNASEPDRVTRTATPLSSCDSQDSSYSHTESSTYSEETYFREQLRHDAGTESSSIMLPSTTDIIFKALHDANFVNM